MCITTCVLPVRDIKELGTGPLTACALDQVLECCSLSRISKLKELTPFLLLAGATSVGVEGVVEVIGAHRVLLLLLLAQKVSSWGVITLIAACCLKNSTQVWITPTAQVRH